MLLEKIATGAVEASQSESESFREDLDRIRNRIGPDAPPADLLLAAGSATQALDGYNKGVSRLLRIQADQLHSIIAMMTETAVKVGGQNLRSVRLQEIGEGLERAGAVKDFETIAAAPCEYCSTERSLDRVTGLGKAEAGIRAMHEPTAGRRRYVGRHDGRREDSIDQCPVRA